MAESVVGNARDALIKFVFLRLFFTIIPHKHTTKQDVAKYHAKNAFNCTPLYGAGTSIPTLVTNFGATTVAATGNDTCMASENDDYAALAVDGDYRFVVNFCC